MRRKSSKVGRTELALIGLLCTLLYDFLTNAAFSLTFNIPLTIAILAGIPFALAHELSNAALFSIVGPELIRFVDRFLTRTDRQSDLSS